jgi:hypothetical protein
MAIIRGNLVAAPVKHTAKSGKDFYRFDLAESLGKGEERKTTFYEVTAFISEMDADFLEKGTYAEALGRIEASAFQKKDGSTGVALKLITGRVTPVESSTRPQA